MPNYTFRPYPRAFDAARVALAAARRCGWGVACAVFALVGGCLKESGDGVFATQTTLEMTPRGDLLADGSSRLLLGYTLRGTASPSRTGVLSTSAGSFAPGTRTDTTIAFGAADPAVALVQLRAPRTPGQSVVRMAVGGAVRTDTLQFRAALPERLSFAPKDSSVITIRPNGALMLTIQLSRSTGLASPGSTFNLTDSESADRVGSFGIVVSIDTTGKYEVRYTPGVLDSTRTGVRRLSACTAGPAAAICDTTAIVVR